MMSRLWVLPFGFSVGILLLLRLGFWGGAFPNPDEAYYWLWGQHWDWSYFDHPPFQAWVNGVTTAWLGRSPWSLRLPNLLTTGLLLALYGVICGHLYGQQRGAWALTLLLVLASPLFFLFLAFAWPDHWLILFTTAAGYSLVRFLLTYPQRPQWGWLYGAAVAVGLGALCKYLAVLLALGMVVAIASHGPWRSLLGRWQWWLAIALAVGITSPIWIWNAQHDWASFQFYLGRSVQANPSSLRWTGPLEFLLLTGVIWGPIHCWGLVPLAQAGASNRFRAVYGRVAGAIALVSTLILALMALRVPILYYWNMVAYPLLFPLLAGVFLAPPFARRGYRHGWGLRAVQGIALFALPLLVVHFTLIPLSALVGASGDEDSRMVVGWEQVAPRVRTEAIALGTDPLLLTTDYRSAAALAYQLKDPTVMAISGRIDQFDFWYDVTALEGRDALLLGDDWHPICPTHEAMFDQVDPLPPITVSRFGRYVKRYTLLRGRNFHAGPDNTYPLSPDYPLAFTGDGQTCQ